MPPAGRWGRPRRAAGRRRGSGRPPRGGSGGRRGGGAWVSVSVYQVFPRGAERSAPGATSTLRYEVAFRLGSEDGVERLELAEELLRPITLEEARRSLGFPASGAFKASAIQGRRTTPFITTSNGPDGPQIKVHQEGHG